ncbi:MAG: hypothetical protein A3F16_03760 [Deltaproteobacteria bacterium RIFCSPHIGHO2_12_FULL_43_9]|nr:MAG: hypothetical protein A3F16_03760 [Deltaproteobacteria bacterium RIFCSPHIGHO2_12_FULL_43_9]
MKQGFRIFLSLCSILLAFGCADLQIEGAHDKAVNRSLASLPPSAPVALYFEKPDKKYEVVGKVYAKGYPAATMGALRDELKRQARKIGANGVIISDEADQFMGSYTDQWGYTVGQSPPEYVPYGYNTYEVFPYRYYPYGPKSFYGFNSKDVVNYPLAEGIAIRIKK